MPQITVDEAGQFGKAMGPKYDRLANEIQKNINKGMTVGAAVDAAVATTGFKAVLTDQLFDNIFSSINRAMRMDAVDDSALAMRKWWLNKEWPGQSLTLAESITDLTKMTEVKGIIKDGMKAQKTWVELSKGIGDRKLVSGEVAEHIKDLERAARRVIGGDATAMTEYRRALRVSQRQIEQLATGGAPSQRLKKAYANVVRQAEMGISSQFEKGIKRAVTAKMRSNADRIARTEIARGYAEGTYERGLSDTDVIGFRYDLSSRHPEADICDFHTGANLYGLGPGGYPMNNLPAYPFHPNCLCVFSNIYSGEVKPLDTKKAQDYLNRQSGVRKKRLLGVKGAKSFEKNPERWRSNLKQYNGHEDIQTLRGRAPF